MKFDNLLWMGTLLSWIKVQQILSIFQNFPTCTRLFQPALLLIFGKFSNLHFYYADYSAANLHVYKCRRYVKPTKTNSYSTKYTIKNVFENYRQFHINLLRSFPTCIVTSFEKFSNLHFYSNLHYYSRDQSMCPTLHKEWYLI